VFGIKSVKSTALLSEKKTRSGEEIERRNREKNLQPLNDRPQLITMALSRVPGDDELFIGGYVPYFNFLSSL
jgi:hypothetical protein